MYVLIKAHLATKYELETCYTLGEALKLYALHMMEQDIEAAKADELKAKSESRR